ncbi:hypothetical protein IFR05_000651 [Cadophora sp. M221]|nr:hypothetical protein IFR05_000651 [Cadophora sp. M221]
MRQSNSKVTPTAQNVGQHTFRVSKPTTSTRKRAKLYGKRREEVKAVRHRRSCLRCSLLKIKCSDDELCATCEQLSFVTRKHEKQTLSFCGCIRTRLCEVSVFEVYIAASGTRNIGSEKSIASTLASISLEFGSQVTWDLGVLVDDIVDWLNNPRLSKTSKVGTLSSPRFLELVGESSGPKAGSLFQQMIYAISRAYTRNDGPLLTAEELHQFGSMAGHDFLRCLDEKLKPMSLARCSHSDMRALFLWVFGTILAVGYAEPSSSTTMQEHALTFKAMQSHLCQILAHYLIFLGSQLGLPIKTGTDQFLLEAAPSRWDRQGQFEWKSPDRSYPFPSTSNSTYYSQHDNSSRILTDEAASSFHENEEWVGDQELNLEEMHTLMTIIRDSHSQLLRLESCVSRISRTSRLWNSLTQESSLQCPAADDIFDLDEGVESHEGYSASKGGGESSNWGFQQDGVSWIGSMPQGDSRTSGSGLSIVDLYRRMSRIEWPIRFPPFRHSNAAGVSGDMPMSHATRAGTTYQIRSALQHLCRGRSKLARRGISSIPKTSHVLSFDNLRDSSIEHGSYGSISQSGMCMRYIHGLGKLEEAYDAETQYLLV